MRFAIVATALAIAFAGTVAAMGQSSSTKGPAAVDAAGHIRVPEGYQKLYQYLGSWAVAADQGQGAKEMHFVYASPGAIAAYQSSGHFPDGTVLVKEVYATSTAPMTTGTVSRADTLKGWFVMVRDTKDDHPGNRLWGDGWGWSWFDAADPVKTTSVDYKTNCQACHVPAKANDWIYTQGYPSLRK